MAQQADAERRVFRVQDSNNNAMDNRESTKEEKRKLTEVDYKERIEIKNHEKIQDRWNRIKLNR